MASFQGTPSGFNWSYIQESEHQGVYDLYHNQVPYSKTHSLPPVAKDSPNVMELLENSRDFKIFTSFVKKSGLENVLRDPNRKVTLFAVPDSVFYKMPHHLWRELDHHDKRSIISFHLLPGLYAHNDFAGTRKFYRTEHPHENLVVDGRGLTVRVGFRHHSASVNPTVNYNAKITGPDNLASNGIVHVINLPMIPYA